MNNPEKSLIYHHSFHFTSFFSICFVCFFCFFHKLAISLFSSNSSFFFLKKKALRFCYFTKSSLSYQSQQYPLVVAAQCTAAENSRLWFKGWHVFPRRLDKQTGINATIDRRSASDWRAEEFFWLWTQLNSQAGSLSLTESETSDDFHH